MRFPGLSIVILLFFLMGCGGKSTSKGSSLPDEQMARLLLDIQLSELSMIGLEKDKKDTLRGLFLEKLSGIYKLSPQEIEQQIILLEQDPEKMNRMLFRIKELTDSIQ